MKQIALPLAFMLVFLLPSRRLAAQTSVPDSLALVDLYNSTNGPGWINHTNWLTAAPLSTWYGVEIYNGQVNFLQLQQNRLIGTLPSSLGNLTAAVGLSFNYNGLTGNIPSSIGNLSSLQLLDLSYNQLTGSIPASFSNLPPYQINLSGNYLSGIIPPMPLPTAPYAGEIFLSSNQFNFTSFESGFLPVSASVTLDNYSPQAYLPLIVNGNVLSVAAGGNVLDNTYTWYNNGSVVATITGDSTFTISGPGIYSVSVTSSLVPGLILSTPTSTNTQDSLALVDLYNNNGGNSWINRTGWLTSAPVITWYGITTQNGRVFSIILPYNNLTGPLSSTIGNLSGLNNLSLYGNQISGPLPASIAGLSGISTIDLDDNQISGTIPAALGSLPYLTELYLNDNQLTGSIPATLGVSENLNILHLSNNQLTGTIPPFTNTPFLDQLELENNQLSGSLPVVISEAMTVFDLSGNQLSDTIPASYPSQIPDVSWFLVNNNRLTGTIPNSFCNLWGVHILQFNDNQLTGPIPDSIGKLTYIYTLALQDNQLSGPIPTSFSNLSQPSTVYTIQNNNFTFNGMQNLPSTFLLDFDSYAPQANVPIAQKSNILSVSVGGTLAQDTFRIYRNGILVATQTGDSSYPVTQLGKYNIVATNPTAPLLTLYSDTVGTNLILPDSTTSITQTFTPDTTIDLVSGIFNLVSLTPTPGANALTGSVTALETIDSSIQTFNGAPYVERHYDITPATNASTAQATITLYFTQADFDAYNAYVTANNIGVPLLPTGGVDNGNVIINQYHGSFTGTSSPGNYSQGSQVIRPTVAWDSVDQWWTVTFPVEGFSGFFLGSGSNPLPLDLLQFTGTPQGYTVNLQWQTTDEQNTKQFIIQRSPDGNVFGPIGTVAANNTTGQNSYAFTDTHPSTGNNFYRLKMQDLNGQFTYSPVVLVRLDAVTLTLTSFAYPNPAHTITSLLFNSGTANNYSIEITDLSGKKLNVIAGTSVPGLNKVDIDVHGYAAGIYTITIIDEEYGRRSVQLSKE
jgi:Leucine-rich repeat (LRR) protein